MEPEPGDTFLVAGDHLELPAAFVMQHRAGTGHCFGKHEGQTAQRVDIFLDHGVTGPRGGTAWAAIRPEKIEMREAAADGGFAPSSG